MAELVRGCTYVVAGELRRIMAVDAQSVRYEVLNDVNTLDFVGISERGFPIRSSLLADFVDMHECAGRLELDLDMSEQTGDSGYGEATLMLLIEAISQGRRSGMSGQDLGAMCSARDDLARLRRTLWAIRDGLHVDGHVCLRNQKGEMEHGPDVVALIDQALLG